MPRLLRPWQVHCARNTVLTLLPFRRQLQRLKRRFAKNPHPIDASSVYDGAYGHINAMRKHGLELPVSTILEIGTGWYPVIPLMLRLAGVRQVHLTDAHPLLDAEELAAACEFLLDRKTDIAQRLGLPLTEVEKYLRVIPGESLEHGLARLGFSYLVPCDLSTCNFKVDAIFSHTCLEHISEPQLRALLRECRHVLRPGGLMSHGVDHSDHRANVDSELSRIDFLRYSDRVWRLFCIDPQDYTNRLRHSDYVRLFTDAGYDITFEQVTVDEKCRRFAETNQLDSRFRSASAEELATLWTHVVLKPAA
jgi:SAM-dependent methyltransferase